MSGARRARHRPSRAVYRRRQLLSLACIVTALALAYIAVSSLFGGSSRSATPPSTTEHQIVTSTTTTTMPTTTTTDPGALAQTAEEPPTDATSLAARLGPLFSAIQADSHDTAVTVFFPESAYSQMKTGVLSNPASDYQSRLVGFYDLDLAAYQRALGASPSTTVLQTVNVNPSYAHWVSPGTCENKIGYWHLPNVRLVYTAGGATQSFAVASLISWRGVWYVVHLGPNPRPSNVGTVDQPATGPGIPGPSGGC